MSGAVGGVAQTAELIAFPRALCQRTLYHRAGRLSLGSDLADRQSIMEYNGGSVVAMVGKDCVAIAGDLRLGQQATGVAMNFEKVFPVNDTLYFGLPGLATDVFTL